VGNVEEAWNAERRDRRRQKHEHGPGRAAGRCPNLRQIWALTPTILNGADELRGRTYGNSGNPSKELFSECLAPLSWTDGMFSFTRLWF
jgi:hypothetical protein